MAAIAFSDDNLDLLQIVVNQDQAAVTIAVAGEWDLAAQTAFRDAITSALSLEPERVVVDLSRLTFIDSSGMRAAAELHRLAVQQDVRFELIPGPRAVQRPFEISGSDSTCSRSDPWRDESRETRQRADVLSDLAAPLLPASIGIGRRDATVPAAGRQPGQLRLRAHRRTATRYRLALHSTDRAPGGGAWSDEGLSGRFRP